MQILRVLVENGRPLRSAILKQECLAPQSMIKTPKTYEKKRKDLLRRDILLQEKISHKNVTYYLPDEVKIALTRSIRLERAINELQNVKPKDSQSINFRTTVIFIILESYLGLLIKEPLPELMPIFKNIVTEDLKQAVNRLNEFNPQATIEAINIVRKILDQQIKEYSSKTGLKIKGGE